MYLPYSSLFILSLCLSFYVCTTRPLVAVDHNVSGKVHEKVKKHGAESKEEGIKVKGNGWVITRASTERSKPAMGVHLKDVKRAKEEEEEEEFSGHLPIKSVVSVSWRVPPNKKQDRHHLRHHPGFYSDYSRPRTRPPSHN